MELIDYPRMRFEAVRRHPVVVTERGAIFEIEGPKAIDCLQGLLTNDVVGTGADALVYGALLTPKGMIVVDCWVLRFADRVVLVADDLGRTALLDLFRRQLPPRLARVTDRSEDWAVAWVLGDGVELLLRRSGEPPAEAHAGRLTAGSATLWIGAGTARAPFRYLVVGPTPPIDDLADRLVAGGAARGDRRDLRAARVRSGWPTLGQEIDDRTMPAEADFEGLGGVSYTKGCYVGQETVARVHFRGHPNWLLRRVSLADARNPAAEVAIDGKPVIRLKTIVRFEDGSGSGLALVRREIDPGSTVGEGTDSIQVAD
jgi:folate-binding protein YgfZ